ncbi:MAG: DUF1893 domain-containing protein [Rikenellaceae bacterium]
MGDLETYSIDCAIERATTLIADGEAKCVVIKGDRIVATYIGIGLRPILEIYRNHPEAMMEGAIVDKVIGRAAAFVAINGGAKLVYGLLMSESAKELLEAHNIEVRYDLLAPEILNRERTDLCPLERSVRGESDPTTAMERIYKQIEILMNNKK